MLGRPNPKSETIRDYNLNHWAIPQEEGMHLNETVHSGLLIGAIKCKGAIRSQGTVCAMSEERRANGADGSTRALQVPEGQSRMEDSHRRME